MTLTAIEKPPTLPRRVKLKPGEALLLRSDEAKEYGYDVQSDWKLRLLGTDTTPSYSVLSPEGFEFKDIKFDDAGTLADYMVATPEGKALTRAEFEAFASPEEPLQTERAQPPEPGPDLWKTQLLGEEPVAPAIVTGKGFTIEQPEPPTDGRKDLFRLMQKLFPDQTLSYGMTEEQAVKASTDTLLQWIQEQPQVAVKKFRDLGMTPDTEALLQLLGATPVEIQAIYEPTSVEDALQPVMPGMTPDKLQDMLENDPDLFVKIMRTGGRTKAKQDLLVALGYSWDDVNTLLGVQQVVVPVDGIRQMVTMTPEGRAYDVNGRQVGRINPVTNEFTGLPEETVLKDWWDAAVLGASTLYKQSKQYMVSTLPNFLFRDMSSVERKVYGNEAADRINEGNRQLRDKFREVYAFNQSEYEQWLTKHPELQPRKEWQEGVGIHPELIKNPAYWVYEFASTAPFMLGVMATMTATTAVTGNPLVGIGAGLAVATPAQSQDAYDALLAAGATEQQAAQIAGPLGILISSIETIGDMPYLKNVFPAVFKMFTKTGAEEIAKLTTATLIKKGIKIATQVEITETLEEVAQQAIQNAGVKIIKGDQSIFEGITDTAIRTAIATAPLAVLGGATGMMQQGPWKRVPPSLTEGLTDAQMEAKGWQQELASGNWYERVKGLAKEFAVSQKGGFEIGPEEQKPEGVEPIPAKAAPEEPTMAPGTTVQPGLPGMEGSGAQVKMFEESGKPGPKPVPLIDAEAIKARESAKPLPGQMELPTEEPAVTPEEIRTEAQLPPTPETLKADYEAVALKYETAKSRLASLEDALAGDPIANYLGQVGARTAGLTSILRGYDFPESVTIKEAQMLMQGSQPKTIVKGRVPTAYVLDQLAEHFGITEQQLIEGIQNVKRTREEIARLKDEVRRTGIEVEEASAEMEPKVKAEDVPPVMAIQRQVGDVPSVLTSKQITTVLKFFGQHLTSTSESERRASTIEMRKQVLATRVANLSTRVEELITEGKGAEQAVKQAEQETMTGKLPDVTTDFYDDVTEQVRKAMFAKVHEVLKDEPFELMSTVEALTNALQGKSIPRDPGTKGGSAYSRLLRVFGPEHKDVLKKLDEAKKPLRNIVEGEFREHTDPIPLDQEMVDYLRSLPTWGSQQVLEAGLRAGTAKGELTFAPTGKTPTVPIGLAGQETLGLEIPGEGKGRLTYEPTGNLGLELQATTMNLMQKPYTEWTDQDIRNIAEKELAYRELELGTALLEKRITKDEYDIELAIAREKARPFPPITHYGLPIDEEVKQFSMLPVKDRILIIRALQETGMTAVDIGNFLRANLASFDYSWWRQVMPLIPGNLSQFFQGNVAGWKSIFSQQAADASWERISRHDPLFQIYEDGADFLVPLTLPKGTEQWKAEEAFGYVSGSERAIPKFTSKLPWVNISQRAFVTGKNEMLWAIYHKFYDAQLKISEKIAAGEEKLPEGEAFVIKNNMIAFSKLLADFSGRAQLGKLGAIAPATNALFFSMRLNMGRLLTPRHLVSSNRYVRREAWRNLSLFVSSFGAVIVGGAALGLWSYEDDPRSTNFMKIRIGNIRLDPWGGYQQFVVFFARVNPFGSKIGLTSDTGMEYTVDPVGAMAKFVRGKASPMASVIVDFWSGKNFLGQKMDIKNGKQWLDRLMPFALQDIWDAYTDQGTRGALIALPALVGANVQTYTGDWKDNIKKLGLPKYADNVPYGLKTPVYDTGDLWADTAKDFKDVDPAEITKQKGFLPIVKAIVEARSIIDGLKYTPNIKLTSINADSAKGDTFVQFYQQWQERQKITDPEKLKEFDERFTNAEKGNITQRQYVLLEKYHSLSKAEQKQFLKDNPEIDQNPYTEWLKSHPEENAKLAIWGKAKLLTQGAYNQAKKLTKELDIPDSALPELTLPPEVSVKGYVEYQDVVETLGANSWEAQLLLAKDEELRKFLNREAITTPVAALELKVKNRVLTEKYEGLDEAGRKAFKADPKNAAWVDDTRRIEAYDKGLPEATIEDYVGYYRKPLSGFEDDWYLQEHSDFYKAMVSAGIWKSRDFSKVPSRVVGALYDRYLKLVEGAPRNQFRVDNPALDEWLIRAKGYTPAKPKTPEPIAIPSPSDNAPAPTTTKAPPVPEPKAPAPPKVARVTTLPPLPKLPTFKELKPAKTGSK